MPRTRKSHPPSLKAKVAVEAIKAHKTAAQIAQMFGVHPTQVGGWKKQALAGRSVPAAAVHTEKVMIIWGALPPKPPGI
jgi:transposase-like protein